MKLLREITQWPGDTPNHIYHVLSNGKLYAYQPWGGETVVFKNPLTFDRARRKFVTVDTVPDPRPQRPTVTVQGSKGNTYTVTLCDPPVCDCAGFAFRGKCKHITQVQSQE